VGHRNGKIPDEVEIAARIYRVMNQNWLVCVSASNDHVILDGDEFSAEQLEAIALLLRHAPDELK
jgi:hypothetical protein